VIFLRVVSKVRDINITERNFPICTTAKFSLPWNPQKRHVFFTLQSTQNFLFLCQIIN